MKAIITTLPGKSVLQEVPMPEMNEDSVLIQLKYCGVCYSEHYEWKTKGGAFGHEPMGTIVQVGKNVEGFSVGDRVSGLWGSTLPGAGAWFSMLWPTPARTPWSSCQRTCGTRTWCWSPWPAFTLL